MLRAENSVLIAAAAMTSSWQYRPVPVHPHLARDPVAGRGLRSWTI
jgi:hypothetical protein